MSAAGYAEAEIADEPFRSGSLNASFTKRLAVAASRTPARARPATSASVGPPLLERTERLDDGTRVAPMTLRRHRQRLVEGTAAMGARHLELREEPRRLSVGKHAQELDDRRRASDLPRLRCLRGRATGVETRDGALRQWASASSGYRIAEASIRTMFAGSW